MDESKYTVRQFDVGDQRGFLALYEEVWELARTAEWFDWRYRSQYLDDIPITVAERDGEIVGAFPCMVFPVRTGETTRVALQPAGLMVHSEHRRRGLLTRMIKAMFDAYADGEPSFFFNLPNDQARPAFLKLGWRDSTEVVSYYRFHSFDDHLESVVGSRAAAIAGPLTTAGAKGYLQVRSTVGSRKSSEQDSITIERHDTVPADLLSSIYERDVPDVFHVLRDETFYRWRFANPTWDPVTYVAKRDESPVAGVVVDTAQRSGSTLTRILDGVSVAGRNDTASAFSEILGAIVDDHDTVDYIKTAGSTIPRAFLSDYGFLPNTFPGLSHLSPRMRVVVRPLSEDDDDWSIDGRRLDDPSNWRFTYSDQEVDR